MKINRFLYERYTLIILFIIHVDLVNIFNEVKTHVLSLKSKNFDNNKMKMFIIVLSQF